VGLLTFVVRSFLEHIINIIRFLDRFSRQGGFIAELEAVRWPAGSKCGIGHAGALLSSGEAVLGSHGAKSPPIGRAANASP